MLEEGAAGPGLQDSIPSSRPSGGLAAPITLP